MVSVPSIAPPSRPCSTVPVHLSQGESVIRCSVSVKWSALRTGVTPFGVTRPWHLSEATRDTLNPRKARMRLKGAYTSTMEMLSVAPYSILRSVRTGGCHETGDRSSTSVPTFGTRPLQSEVSGLGGGSRAARNIHHGIPKPNETSVCVAPQVSVDHSPRLGLGAAHYGLTGGVDQPSASLARAFRSGSFPNSRRSVRTVQAKPPS